MGKRWIVSAILVMAVFSCNNDNQQIIKIQDVINKIENEYAPDPRTAIFDIEPENTKPIILKGETNLAEAKSSLLSRIQATGITIEDRIILLPDKPVINKKLALINVSVANLRVNPRHSAELATQAILGTPVHLLKKESGWYLVQTPDKYIAWTNSGSLTLMDQSQFSDWENSTKIIYLNTHGYAMNEAGTQRVSDLVAGNILILDHETETNFVVTYPDGRKGVVNKNEAKTLDTWYDLLTLSDSSFSAAAKDLLGVPYLWGGTSTKGVDCSGFTKTVYFLHGLVIPRDASQQVRVGVLVDKDKDFSKLEVGDLLFFGKINDDRTERVVHVGMWLGNNQFIHASGDVHISSMDSLDDNYDRYNFNRYLRSKRIIGGNKGFIPNIQDIY